jgi:DNA end-binding protein Ku
MAPIPVWSGNLRLSLVLVPVRLFPATSTEGTIAFRMIHEPSGKPIKYLKGIETERGFKEVPEEEIIRGYEHTKGHHVLIKPEELDAVKLEAKHTIDMARFVDRDEIDSRYFEKPYYLLPTCCRMAMKPTKGTFCCATPWPKARRWPSDNSSCMAASTWSASPRTRRDSCW